MLLNHLNGIGVSVATQDVDEATYLRIECPKDAEQVHVLGSGALEPLSEVRCKGGSFYVRQLKIPPLSNGQYRVLVYIKKYTVMDHH